MAGQRTVEFVADDSVAVNDPVIRSVQDELARLNLAIALTEFTFEHTGTSGTEYTYTYEWEATDGRVWSQILVFTGDGDTNPRLGFGFTDTFHLDEFAPHRAVRDAAVKARNDRGLTLLKVEWSSV